VNQKVMMFGGRILGNWQQDCWIYDGVAWTPGPVPPIAVEGPALAWEPARNRMLLLGQTSPTLISAWELNNGWQPTTAPQVGPRTWIGRLTAVHDVARGRFVAFVGTSVAEFSPSVPAVDDLGGGCSATIAPQLAAVGQPLLGTTTWLDATDTGSSFVILVMATSTANLPVGSCTLVPALGEFAEFRPTPAGFASFALAVPRAAVLHGLQVAAQVLAADAGAPLGLVATDALRLTLGS
jgi:hypothetical protein